MNKILKFIRINWTLLLVFIILFFVCLANKKHLTISSSSDLILFITFVALLWYTYETRKTRLNSEKQVELSLTPVMSLELIENQDAGYNFKLKNVGLGLAQAIKITNNTVVCRNNAYDLKDNEEKKAVPKFNIPCFLYSGEEKLLTPLQKGEQYLWIIKEPGFIKIEYRNLEGKIYSRKFAIKERCKDQKGWTYYQIELED